MFFCKKKENNLQIEEGDIINKVKLSTYNIIIKSVKYMVLAFTCIILLFAVRYSFDSSDTRYVRNITEEWEDKQGNKIDLEKICSKNINSKEYNVSYKINGDNELDKVIVFRASSSYVDIYIDGKLIEQDKRVNIKMFGSSPGHRWHMVNVPTDNKEHIVSLSIKPVYSDGKGRVDNVYIGTQLGVVHKVINDRISGFIISIVLIIIGIGMVILYYIVINKRTIRNENDLNIVTKIVKYLGLLTICIGIYSLMETYFCQFFVGKSEFFQFITYFSLFFIGIIVGLIGKEVLKKKQKIVAIIIYWFSIVGFIVSTILNCTGVLEYHYVMQGIYFYGAILSIAVFFEGYNYIKNQEYIDRILLFGISFFSVTFACDCIRYLTEIPDDICAYMRVGYLILITCIFIVICKNMIKGMEKGVYADLYRKMANTDPLTGLNNRNALIFDECKLNELVRNDKKIAVVMFDVNNLKYVNDTFGHEQGDALIRLAAELINNSFGNIGKCYRTGGDEFVALLVTDNVEEKYSESLTKFLGSIDEYNKSHDNEVSVAYGVYIAENEVISDMRQKADEIMYEKKKEMKKKLKNNSRC